MGWTDPACWGKALVGVVLLVIFGVIETRVAEPMFNLALFRIRAFSAGNLAVLLASLGRGGMMFMLIIWLQGIWLPLHGYSFERTPLWAGVYMLPLTIGFLIAGPASGWLSDRFGARPFATGGMLVAALDFWLLEQLPVDFHYLWFAALLLLMGLALGLFSSPNQSGIMNSLPADQRGAGAGMTTTFQNAAQVLSIGIFFSLMIAGLSSSLPSTMERGLRDEGVPAATASSIAHQPPVGLLFASFLGYNPMGELLKPVQDDMPPAAMRDLTSRSYFPKLMAEPFSDGLRFSFGFAALACLVAAGASWLRGGHYVHPGAHAHAREAIETLDGELAAPAVE
jgi:MFS family permease